VLRDIKRNLSEADRVIVNTAFIRDEAEEVLGIPAGTMDVIPLAPSAGYHVSDRTASRERIRRFTEKDYILCVGTIEPRKNIKTLIRAFADLRRGHDLTLILAGGFGWKYEDILACPADLGIRDSVVFTGYVDETTMNDLYNCAAVFVYPSLYEGFGLPPLEAMSCGAPVITSDIPPLREVAGDAALRFSTHDHAELSQCLERVLSDPELRAGLSGRGLRRVKEFSWQRAALETISTYERVLAR
jgi:glycosyltransferase involved in cell wall biosynthesis